MTDPTPVGPGSRDSSAPTPVLPLQYSVTTYDTSEGPLYYTFTPDTSGWIRVDGMLSNAADAPGFTVRIEEGDWDDWSKPIPGSPSIRNASDDRGIFTRAGIPITVTVYSYLGIEADGWTPIHGIAQLVVRFSAITPWTNLGDPIIKHSGVETFEALPLGQIHANYPYPTGYVNGILKIDSLDAYRMAVDSHRAHGGTKSLRMASPNLPNASSAIASADFKETVYARNIVSYGDLVKPTYGRVECWAHFNSAYPNSSHWHINDYFQGLGGLGVDAASLNNRPIMFSLNTNGRGGTTYPYATSTVRFFAQRSNSAFGTGNTYLDTAINPWDRWLKYVLIADFDAAIIRAEIHDADQMLWSYETPTTGFSTDGGNLSRVWTLAVDPARIGDSSSSLVMTGNDFMDYYDDLAWEFSYRWPAVPELYEVPLGPLVADPLSVARRFWR
jgi:hypothetical protein